MTRILLFGDSLSAGGGPGVVLARELTQHGNEVAVNARVGRSAWNFYDREEHAAIVAAELAKEPELVVVWLGTNELGLSSKTNLVAFTRLRADLGKNGARVIAIGPPAFADAERREESTAVYAVMRTVFGPVVDARPRSLDLREAPYRTSDGVHFTARGAEVLGVRLADELVAKRSDWTAAAAAAIVLAIVVTWLSKGGVTM